MPTVEPLGVAGQYKKPSPSPSVKRGKAEKLLKEHGSPPGIRVTAGGRVVPSDLPPLGTSRYPNSGFGPQPFRVTPSNIMPIPAQQSNDNTARIEVVGGQPVVFVGDRMFALPAVNHTTTSSFTPANMDHVGKQAQDLVTLPSNGTLSALQPGPQRAQSQSPFSGLDLATLRTQQALKKQELRTVEQTEVLQAGTQTDAWRATMIEKKRCLIVELDALRKQIATQENDSSSHAASAPSVVGTVPPNLTQPSFVPHMAPPLPSATYPRADPAPYTPLMMYPTPYGLFPSYQVPENTPFMVAPTPAPVSPGTAARRSHAIEIKPPPHEETKKQLLSALDPKSPTYEPPTKNDLIRDRASPMATAKRSPWHLQESAPIAKSFPYVPSRKPSLSSVDTTDFFPTNTHEHSTTRLAPNVNEHKKVSPENTALPSTPEKDWPASPWNDATSGRSKENESSTQLTSWPEAFGKQQSTSTLRRDGLLRPSHLNLERAPMIGNYIRSATASESAQFPSSADPRNGSAENWPFGKKAVAYVPATYQEGYQAGYDHVGLSDDPEVLQGYIQGLLHFLSDESKHARGEQRGSDLYVRGIDARTPSLRGLVVGSSPQDSAVSMTFRTHLEAAGGQENLRLPKIAQTADSRVLSALHPKIEGDRTSFPKYPMNVGAQPWRSSTPSAAMYPNLGGMTSDGLATMRQDSVKRNGNDASRLGQDTGISPRADTMNSGGFRTFSGNQLQSRGYGTPLSMQRFYPSSKELNYSGPGNAERNGETYVPRPLADHRLSGLDGAMDDLAELVTNTHVESPRPSTETRSAEAPIPVEVEEAEASCFKSSNNKGKNKLVSSPKKSAEERRDKTVSSPVNVPGSPKKSGELSPAKVKLEQVTNKFRRSRKDDPRTMSPEDKKRRTEKWRKRFQNIKATEEAEMNQCRRDMRS